MQYIIDKNISLACITESWLMDSNNHITFRIKCYGFLISHEYRKSGVGGGVCFIYKPNLQLRVIKHNIQYQSFEYHCVKILSTNNTSDLSIAGIYRKQEVAFTQFYTDFRNFYENVIEMSHSYFLIVGDFNVHYERSYSMSNELGSLTTSYGLAQHVQIPTNIFSHTIDLIFSNVHEVPVHSVNADPSVAGQSMFKFDHFPVAFSLNYYVKPTKDSYKDISYRNINTIDYNDFNNTLEQRLHTVSDVIFQSEFITAVTTFNDCLESVLDDFAPCKTKRVYNNPNHVPIKWIDEEYRLARNKRRKLERAWIKHPGILTKQMYNNQKNLCARMAKSKMSVSLSCLINDREKVSDLFKLVYKVLDRDCSYVLPDSCSNDFILANEFNCFFLSKIESIREQIPYCTEKRITDFTNLPLLNEFSSIDVDYLRNIFKKTDKIKTSPIDPLPGKVVSNCIETLLTYLVTIINKSFSEGHVEGLKKSVVIPSYKVNEVDFNAKNSYRPLFSIVFVCKIIEKVVLKQFTEHISDSCYDSPYQHGYKKFHSTETMLLELYDEVLLGFDNDFCTVVVMIDMSAAFDTVDLDILLHVLSTSLNIKGNALSWFQSFLKNRLQCVKINNCYSDCIESKYGVPPGSTLGPILFNVYSKGLSDVILKSGFKTSSYADDSNGRLQFMINMQYSSLTVDVPVLLKNVQDYMNKSYLKMNSSKTDVFYLFPPSLSKKVINGIFLDSECVRFSNESKLLGVTLDSNLNFNSQVNNVVSACQFKLKGIRRIRHLMSCKDTEKYVRAVIFSKINYCNVLYMNLSTVSLNKLQKLQNSAMRLIFNFPPRVSVTEKYEELQILRIDQSIVFSCLIHVHKFFRNQVPQCISNLLEVKNTIDRLLTVHYYSSNYARKSFSYCAPRYWNKLPLCIRLTDDTSKFKGLLKSALLQNCNNIMSAITGYYFLPR